MRQMPARYFNLILLIGLISTLQLSTVKATTTAASDDQRSFLLQILAGAETESDGRRAEDAMWQFWFNEAPNQNIRTELDDGMERREAYDFEAAENHFDTVIRGAPDYAEGYNQRAFVRFLRENFDNALTDLEKALEHEPDHFGALSGMYHILRIKNRHKAAMGVLRQAVTIHPWLQERGALPKELWPDNYRNIHEPGLKL